MERFDRSQPQQDALMLDVARDAEKRGMLKLLRLIYADGHEPRARPVDRLAADSLYLLTGPLYDRRLREFVTGRDLSGIELIGRFMPRLTNPEVRALARAMRTASRKEIAAFRRESTYERTSVR